jgi:alkaline phosphatase D
MDDRTTRRSFVGAALLAAGGLYLGPQAPVTAAAKRLRREPRLRAGAFRHGVASGLPEERAIVLWTRVSDVEAPGRIKLEVARDADFRRLVHRQTVRAAPVRDFTARARITPKALRPGEQYFYRFSTATTSSPVGRFKTALPLDSREPVRLGIFSCQDWQAGFYTAHRGLAQEEDLDLVLCLGDYVYERNFYEGPRTDRLGANRDGEVQTLSEYRDKYALYRTDPDLQALHAAHPFVAIWDDHEVEDNWARDHPGRATLAPRVPFAERRRVGFLAFYEWMPRFRPREAWDQCYGAARLGRNVEVVLLDTRRFRDEQPCGDRPAVPCPEGEAPGRTLLGAEQKRWFVERITASGAQWKVVGNQVMMMSLDSAPGVALNPDQWDGYAAERREVLTAFRNAGVRDLTFATGDIHTFFAGDVHVDGRVRTPPIGTEFVAGSVSSLGLNNDYGEAGVTAVENAAVTNPHVRFANGRRRGYAVMEATPSELKVTFRSPRTTLERTSPVDTLARFRVAAGSPRVERV